jgi:hypothetical protein
MAGIEKLFGLGAVLIFAVAGVIFMLRLGGRAERQADEVVLGYPPSLFPAVELTAAGQLAALAATQTRLATIYRQLPAQSDLTIWLRAFLDELREIMDTAYRLRVITKVYGKPAQLDRLVEEVQEIERQVAEQVARRLLARDGDSQQELLDGRLATLRLCMRELGSFAAEGKESQYQALASEPQPD